MKAIAKAHATPGVEIVEVDEPSVGPGQVKIRVRAASVCGTDLHIYSWDPWAAGRIVPPRIIGHEFCGEIVEIGPGVEDRHVGQYVASESHIVCGHCRQCLNGQAHVCVNTKILGVDVDGGFARYAVIPKDNARPTDPRIPPEIAAFQDALGNAVHTAYDGPIADQTILITGLGPIGLFAASVCQAACAAKVMATEISPYRRSLAQKLGLEHIFSPLETDVDREVERLCPGGVDGTLEMSGHSDAFHLGIRCTRPGGRISVLGVYSGIEQTIDVNAVIFKGLRIQGIVGRRLWETWDQMQRLLYSGRLNLSPVVTHRMHFTRFAEAMELMKAGQAGKIVFTFED